MTATVTKLRKDCRLPPLEFGPATRRQEVVEPLTPNAARILVLARENGAVMVGEAGVVMLDLMRRGYVLVTPMGARRYRVEATTEGLAAVDGVSFSNQDLAAERHRGPRKGGTDDDD